MAKPQVIDRITGKVSGFIIICKLYIRMKIREEAAENLETGILEYEIAEEFLADIKKEFSRDGKSSRIEEIRVERKNNKRICTRV